MRNLQFVEYVVAARIDGTRVPQITCVHANVLDKDTGVLLGIYQYQRECARSAEEDRLTYVAAHFFGAHPQGGTVIRNFLNPLMSWEKHRANLQDVHDWFDALYVKGGNAVWDKDNTQWKFELPAAVAA